VKDKNWLLVAVAAAIIAGGEVVPKSSAAEPSSEQRPLRGEWLQRAKEKLGLTEDQIEKIKTEFQAEKVTLKDLISDLHDAHSALRQAIHAPDATETSVRAASARVASVEADFAVERLKLYRRISPVLTGEQLEQLKQFQAKIDEFVERAIDWIGDRVTSK
jgi:Spy/CpxP family protein refolding chaperone